MGMRDSFFLGNGNNANIIIVEKKPKYGETVYARG